MTALTPQEVRAVFPLFLATDRTLTITHAGPAWARLGIAPVGHPWASLFTVMRPHLPDTLPATFAARATDPFHIRLSGHLHDFRGQLLVRPEGFIFLLTPAVRTPHDLARMGLGLTDLAIHDPTADLLVYLQSLTTALADARELTHRLRKRRRELSEAKRVAEQARARAEEAAEARFLFLAAMSHEIRTPLHGVLGMARLLDRTLLDSTQRQLLTTLQRSGGTLQAIIDDVLDFSRLESGQVVLDATVFSPVEAVHQVRDLLDVTARDKGLELRVHIGPEAHRPTLGDPHRFQQLLLNLVGNALKFTSVGHVAIRLHRTDDHLHCAVEDTGIGIAPDARAHIFQPFIQADASTARRYGGTGLGLGICQRIVDAMGGTIRLESTLGQGTTFFLALPMAPLAEPVPTPVRAPLQVPRTRPSGPLRVLLVEDNEVNQQVGRLTFEARGWTVDVASNGLDSVRMAAQTTYDVVFMDIQMPDMDGYEATRQIRASCGDQLPIVAMTANAMPSHKERCLQAGMDDFLAKPLVPGELDRVVAALL